MQKNKTRIDVSIVIPIYNEEKILNRQILNISKGLNSSLIENYEVILVANGCTDNTINICNKLKRHKRVRIIILERADYGMALRAGMSASNGKIIINYDIDFYDINFLLQSLALVPLGYDVIVASKGMKLSLDNRGLLRRIISGLYKYVLFYGFGLRVSDTHGIKSWRNDAELKKLIHETKQNREVFDTELIIRSQYAGRRLLELPTSVNEIRKPVSSIFRRAVRGSFQILRLWFRIKMIGKK